MQTAFFGLLGVVFVKLECEPAPLLLGFVLGPMMEENLRRAMLLSRGDPTVFFTRPISAGDAGGGDPARAGDRAPEHPQATRRSVPGSVTPDGQSRVRRDRASRQTVRLDWSLPYASRRQPVCARNVVATSQPLAAQAGIAMLARGGNAVDAALATAIALTVVEPCSNGIGSDLFAILWDGNELVGLNASGRAPAAWSPCPRFTGCAQMPQRGWDTVTIPGAVSGWAALSQRFGKLPFADLFEPRDPLRARRLCGFARRRRQMATRGAA